jgi:hypothetical protein
MPDVVHERGSDSAAGMMGGGGGASGSVRKATSAKMIHGRWPTTSVVPRLPASVTIWWPPSEAFEYSCYSMHGHLLVSLDMDISTSCCDSRKDTKLEYQNIILKSKWDAFSDGPKVFFKFLQGAYESYRF